MRCKRLLLLIVPLVVFFNATYAQRIVYSEPERDDSRRMDFDIIGKMDGNYIIYKHIRNSHYISLLNSEMQWTAKVEQDYIPDDKLINIDFFPYQNFFYTTYQYQKKNVVYCMAAKIDSKGNKLTDPIMLDSTHIGFASNNKIYTVLTSDDKSKLLVLKINSKNKQHYVIKTLLFDDKFELLKKSEIGLDMEDRNEYVDEFYVDNDGDYVFTKFYRQYSDIITRGAMVIKPAMADSFDILNLDIEKKYLDEIHLKVDNINKRYYLTSFYYKEKRGNIEGIYYYVWNKADKTLVMQKTVELSDELRKEARGDAGIRSAFNDYFIRNVIPKKDGGFLLSSEAFYTTSRYNSWNRWNYLYGSPYYSPLDYYNYSPYYNSLWYRSRFYNNSQATRYHADNIMIISFDKDGNVQWNNIIAKEQFDDDSDDLISYQLMNTGGQLHFLFNKEERRINLLNDFYLSPDGTMNRNPTLKNLDKNYEFMAKYGKQVSARELLIPCLYRNTICFAKVEYN